MEQIMDDINWDAHGQATLITARSAVIWSNYATNIGWLGMMRGYLSNGWQPTYEQTHQVSTGKNQKDWNKYLIKMAGWQKKILQTKWSLLIKLGTTRNDEHHGWDKESRDKATCEVLHKELQALYLRKQEYPLQVQLLL
jgi:hypothetical protein